MERDVEQLTLPIIDDEQISLSISAYRILMDNYTESESKIDELSAKITDLNNEKAALVTAITLLKEKLYMVKDANAELIKENKLLENQIDYLNRELNREIEKSKQKLGE